MFEIFMNIFHKKMEKEYKKKLNTGAVAFWVLQVENKLSY